MTWPGIFPETFVGSSMLFDQLSAVLKELRRRPIHGDCGGDGRVSYGREDVCRLLPHREPFLLVDSIDGLNITERTIRGCKRVLEDDPVFSGHFPGQPVYPGVLQIEAMGQLALCLASLISEHDPDTAAALPLRLRVTRVHHAVFFEPVLPNDLLTLHARILDDNGIVAISTGQIYKGSRLCACSVQEACFVD